MIKLDEVRIVGRMIHIYCRHHHRSGKKLCSSCSALNEYSKKRVENCPYKTKKHLCSECSTHCYYDNYRDQIKKVMRFSSIRFLLFHPVSAVKYLLKKSFKI